MGVDNGSAIAMRDGSDIAMNSGRGCGPKNVKFSNGTYIKSDMPESINR
jgi:hypothetical protein